MATYNLKATIILEVDNYEDADLDAALQNLKKDLETRFPSNFTNIIVTTEEKV